jgi:hypothetical protein
MATTASGSQVPVRIGYRDRAARTEERVRAGHVVSDSEDDRATAEVGEADGGVDQHADGLADGSCLPLEVERRRLELVQRRENDEGPGKAEPSVKTSCCPSQHLGERRQPFSQGIA